MTVFSRSEKSCPLLNFPLASHVCCDRDATTAGASCDVQELLKHARGSGPANLPLNALQESVHSLLKMRCCEIHTLSAQLSYSALKEREHGTAGGRRGVCSSERWFLQTDCESLTERVWTHTIALTAAVLRVCQRNPGESHWGRNGRGQTETSLKKSFF